MNVRKEKRNREEGEEMVKGGEDKGVQEKRKKGKEEE